jgi:MFS family permease
MVGGAITVGVIFFVQTPLQLVIVRFLPGATSGTVAAATALVAAETPRNRVGWALGLVTSAVALGSAVGPVVGGVAGSAFGLRLVFLVGGILLLIATIPVLIVVSESPLRPKDRSRPGVVALIKQRPGALRALAILIGAQGLVTVVNTATQQLVVLKLIEMLGRAASTATGLSFGAAGLTSSASAVGYTTVTRRIGYVRTTALAALLLAITIAVLVVAPSPVVVVIAVGISGLVYGAILPATSSMIGLEAPVEAQSTVFGFNASAVAFGFFLGPLIGGGIAATSGVPVALAVASGLAVMLSLLLVLGTREPPSR